MTRPTARDVARVSGVSLATVDRVLNGRGGVRQQTRERVHAAMRELDYVRDMAAANLSKGRFYRFVFVLPEGPNAFMRGFEREITNLQEAFADERITLLTRSVPAFDAAALAALLDSIAPGEVDGVALVATDAVAVRDAVGRLRGRGIHVVTLVSDLPSSLREHFVGIDNVVAGRTAAGLVGRFCAARQGSIAVIAGSMLVRDHVERRLGFEQVMRGEFPALEPLTPLEGRDDPGQVEDLLCGLLARRDDIVGIYSLGAGNRGIVRALEKRRGEAGGSRLPIVVHELTDLARQALQSGVFDAVINQDIGHEVRSAARVLRALVEGRPILDAQERIRVEIFMRDNLP